MAVPPFQDFMLPFLEAVADQKEHSISEMFEHLAKVLSVSDEDIKELVPSGRETRFKNRAYWARVYLVQAKLLDATGRGRFKITDRGLQLLASNPTEINKKILEQYPEFVEFEGKAAGAKGAPMPEARSSPMTAEIGNGEQLTPEEMLESSYVSLRQQLATTLLEQIMKSSPEFFERLVVDVLVAMGYGGSREDAGQAMGKSGDGGIDGIIKEDRLGLDVVYLQAKRWENSVGSPEIQSFVGSLELHGANKGVFITTSKFTKTAYETVRNLRSRKVVLIDGAQLAELMMDFKVGVTEVASYSVRKIDLEYFDLE